MMTNYNGPDGFTAHCTTCGQLKIRHSFVGSRCPGTFEQGPVVQKAANPDSWADVGRVRMAAQHEAARTAALHEPQTVSLGPMQLPSFDKAVSRYADALDRQERQKQIDSAEWVSRVSDALVAAKELVEDIDNSHYGHCHGCAAPLAGRHYPSCPYEELRDRILAAP